MPTTYLSPGVYVEEVPSAQQPIAGVGTNTVGFIGVLPPVIKTPVPNDWYDPHLAEVISRGEGSTDKSRKEHETATKQLESLVKNARAAAEAEKKNEEAASLIKAQEAAQKKLSESISKLEADLAKPSEPPLTKEQRAQIEKERDQKKTDLTKANVELEDLKKRQSEGVTNDDFLKPYKLRSVPLSVRAADAKLCTSFTEYTEHFGSYSADDPEYAKHRALTHAVAGFFKNGGTRCFVVRAQSENKADIEKALQEIESIDEIAIVAAPGLWGRTVWSLLAEHCELMKDRFAILDTGEIVGTADELDVKPLSYALDDKGNPSEYMPERNRNAALYFPHIEVIDPAKQLQDQDPFLKPRVDPKNWGKVYVPPSGHVAGVYARVDAERGVHKAPGNEAILGANDVRYYVSNRKQDLLNPQGVNCIRNVGGNIRIYGARTVGGDKNGEWKYVNVRRVMLFLKESIDEGTQWVVFEPNDPALWAKIRRNVGAFLTNVWRSGALFGTTPQQAFYVKCDEETNPVEVRDLGQVVTEVGVAIVRPAEFVIFRVTQWAGPKAS